MHFKGYMAVLAAVSLFTAGQSVQAEDMLAVAGIQVAGRLVG